MLPLLTSLRVNEACLTNLTARMGTGQAVTPKKICGCDTKRIAHRGGLSPYTHRIHGAAIYGNMDPINIPPLC